MDLFDRGADKEKLIEDAKKAGFERAVAYYMPSQTNFKDREEAFERVAKVVTIPPEKEGVIRKKFLELLENHEEKKGGLGLDFEALYLIAYK